MDQFFQRILCRPDLRLSRRRRGIDHRSIQYLSGGVHHSQLAPCPESGIPSQDHSSGNGRLHKKLFQILSEYTDRSVLRFLRKVAPDLPLDRRGDQAFITVFHHFLKNGSGIGVVLFDHLAAKPSQDLLLRRIDLHGEDLFLLASVQGKDPMSRNFAHRLLELIIHLIYRRFLRFLRRRNQSSLIHRQFPDMDSVIRLVGNIFCQDILRSRESVLCRLHVFLLRQEGFRLLKGRFLRRLQHQDVRQRFQTLLLRHSRPGAPLRPVGTVKILHHHQSPGVQDLRFQFRRKFSLFFYTSENLFLLLFQISQIKESFMKRAELLVVQGTCGLLAVTRDKGNGTSLVDQLHRSLHLPALYFKLPGYFQNNIHIFLQVIKSMLQRYNHPRRDAL